MLRYLTAGESHGQALVVIVEGLPAGLPVTMEDIQEEMGRRRVEQYAPYQMQAVQLHAHDLSTDS